MERIQKRIYFELFVLRASIRKNLQVSISKSRSVMNLSSHFPVVSRRTPQSDFRGFAGGPFTILGILQGRRSRVGLSVGALLVSESDVTSLAGFASGASGTEFPEFGWPLCGFFQATPFWVSVLVGRAT